MPDLGDVGLVDLIVLGVVVLAVVGALRHRRGVLGALGAALGALVLVWVAAVAVTVWGPPPASRAVQDSAFVAQFPMPDRALHDLHDLDRPGPAAG